MTAAAPQTRAFAWPALAIALITAAAAGVLAVALWPRTSEPAAAPEPVAPPKVQPVVEASPEPKAAPAANAIRQS